MDELIPHANEVAVTEEILNKESSRRAFLGTLLGGAAAATTLIASPSTVFGASGQFKHAAASIPKSDAHILNFALTLEHLEARYYEKASAKVGARYGSYMRLLINTLRVDEESHVNGLTAAIRQAGYTPVGAARKYNFPNVFGRRAAFLSFSNTLETTGVHAYLGQAPHIKTPSILLTAASIVTVEARHTGAFRALLQRKPTDGPFDSGLTEQQILSAVTPLIGR